LGTYVGRLQSAEVPKEVNNVMARFGHQVGDNLDLDQLGAIQMHILLQAMATP
jgi:hypothetical protein